MKLSFGFEGQFFLQRAALGDKFPKFGGGYALEASFIQHKKLALGNQAQGGSGFQQKRHLAVIHLLAQLAGRHSEARFGEDELSGLLQSLLPLCIDGPGRVPIAPETKINHQETQKTEKEIGKTLGLALEVGDIKAKSAPDQGEEPALPLFFIVIDPLSGHVNPPVIQGLVGEEGLLHGVILYPAAEFAGIPG